jgi:hypothetical protein
MNAGRSNAAPKDANEELLARIQRRIAALDEMPRWDVDSCAATMRGLISRHGDTARLAILLVHAELALESKAKHQGKS